MSRKVILIADPGIDVAFAMAVALADADLDLLAVVPCAGNVSAAQATANVQIILDQLDPAKRPRTASALPTDYGRDAAVLHGTDGLGNTHFAAVERHAAHPADKVIAELVRAYPGEVSVISLGPATTIAHTLDRDPELIASLDRLVLVAGTWREPGDDSACAEFHLRLDPEAVQRILHLGLHPIILPLDVTRKLILCPTELLNLPNPGSRTAQFLSQLVPYGLRASAEVDGIEGLRIDAVIGVVAVALSGAVRVEDRPVDVETSGHLTRGMLVVDDRPHTSAAANASLGIDLALGEVQQYITRVLARAD